MRDAFEPPLPKRERLSSQITGADAKIAARLTAVVSAPEEIYDRVMESLSQKKKSLPSHVEHHVRSQ